MEEYFVQKCVAAEAAEPRAESPSDVSTWTTAQRCECVMVTENGHANGASRAVVASIIAMTCASKKTRRVVLVRLDPAFAPPRGIPSGEKLEVLDVAADGSCLDALLTDDACAADSPLLTKIQRDVDRVMTSDTSTTRPHVVIVDSLNVLLEIYPLARILMWLRQLRRDPRIGSVVFRLNASALVVTTASSSSVVQALAHETTAVVQVETPSSLRAYPILAKERRREIPKRMHGMMLLLRKKKNGRTSESVEYFHVANGRITYSSDGEHDALMPIKTSQGSATRGAGAAPPAPPPATTIGSGKALPVGADEVSFNLSISAEEETAKRNVELPYMHQGSGGGTGDAVNNLLFIDEDDPDWDDDDLDDDLDI